MGKEAAGVTGDLRAKYRNKPFFNLLSSAILQLVSLEGGTAGWLSHSHELKYRVRKPELETASREEEE